RGAAPPHPAGHDRPRDVRADHGPARADRRGAAHRRPHHQPDPDVFVPVLRGRAPQGAVTGGPVMKRTVAVFALLLSLGATSLAWAQALPTAAPEAVGLSSQKLARVTELVKGEIAKGRYPGAVALVARRG